MYFKIFVLFLISCGLFEVKSDTTNQDVYVKGLQADCYKSNENLSCLKYRVVRYISSFSNGKLGLFGSESDAKNTGFNFVKIDNVKPTTDDFYPEARQLDSDSEVDKIMKFVQRMSKVFLVSHGISFELNNNEDGARLIDQSEKSNDYDDTLESRGKKKKKLAIILPLLILAKLFKVKLLLIPILLGVLAIKKLIIGAAIFIPYYIKKLMICKGEEHHSWVPPSAHDFGGYSAAGGTGFGGYGGFGGGGGSTYTKDWAARRAYGGYRMKQNEIQNNIAEI